MSLSVDINVAVCMHFVACFTDVAHFVHEQRTCRCLSALERRCLSAPPPFTHTLAMGDQLHLARSHHDPRPGRRVPRWSTARAHEDPDVEAVRRVVRSAAGSPPRWTPCASIPPAQGNAEALRFVRSRSMDTGFLLWARCSLRSPAGPCPCRARRWSPRGRSTSGGCPGWAR